jgi:subtilase family serine protease
VEALEDRLMPSVTTGLPAATARAAAAAARAGHAFVPLAAPGLHPPVIVFHPPVGPDGSPTPPSMAFTPSQIRRAYALDQLSFFGVTGDGRGQTIAIIDAFDNPKFVSSTDANFAASDLHQFDLQFGLPDPPSFIKMDQNGGTNFPGVDPTPPGGNNFELEEALDVEWAHAIAPQANLILIETKDASPDNLIGAGVSLARSLPQVSVVSMSFGAGEDAGQEQQFDGLFTTPAGHQGITFLASTGDSGAPGGYPAFSPNVVAVGGTSLTTDAAGNYVGESGWSGSGGGVSQFEPQPLFQAGVVTQSATQRTIPDVAFDADPNTGVAVYDSYNGAASGGPWFQIGGTSLACPCWAAVVAVADQGRARIGLGSLDGPSQTLPTLYRLPAADFHDIVSGNNGFAAGPGYDLVTGRGSPNTTLIADLAGIPPDQLHPFRTFRYVYHPEDDTYTGSVTLSNNSDVSLPAPAGVVLADLPAGVTVVGNVQTTATGVTFVPLPFDSPVPPHTSVQVPIQLSNPLKVPLGDFFDGFTVQLIYQTS